MFLILVLIIFILVLNSGKWRRKRYCPPKPQQTTDPTYDRSNACTKASAASDTLPYDKAYQKKWLLTMNEKDFYRQLNSFAVKKNMTVFTKVRLLDLLEPIRKQPKYKTYLYKVQAKHVDFVLCDEKLVARYIIELDDASHMTPDRTERDLFVDTVLESVGYKVLRLKAFDEIKIEQTVFAHCS